MKCIRKLKFNACLEPFFRHFFNAVIYFFMFTPVESWNIGCKMCVKQPLNAPLQQQMFCYHKGFMELRAGWSSTPSQVDVGGGVGGKSNFCEHWLVKGSRMGGIVMAGEHTCTHTETPPAADQSYWYRHLNTLAAFTQINDIMCRRTTCPCTSWFGSSIYLFFPTESQRAEMGGTRAGGSLLDNRKYSSEGEEEGGRKRSE